MKDQSGRVRVVLTGSRPRLGDHPFEGCHGDPQPAAQSDRRELTSSRSRIATCTLEAEILSTSLDYADCFWWCRYVHFCTRLSFDCTSIRVRTRRRLNFALTWRRVTC